MGWAIGARVQSCALWVLHPLRSLNAYFDKQEAEMRQLRRERGWSARRIADDLRRGNQS